MRQYASPSADGAARNGANLTADLLAHVERDGETVLFRRRTGLGDDSPWHDVTAARFRAEVTAVAKGLLAADIRTGDRVGLMSRTRYEWTLVDYACWWIGAVTVPVYASSTPDEVLDVLADTGAAACVVEAPQQATWLRGGTDAVPALRHVWALDDGGLDQLSSAGATVADDILEAARAAVTPDHLATVVYTPGTTGRRRGCCLTHANLMAEVDAVSSALPELFDEPDRCTLLFLPLAHVYARVIQVACVRSGTPLGHSSDLDDLTAILRHFRPTFVVTPPPVLEQIHEAAVRSLVMGRGRVFDAASSTAIAYSRALDDGRPGLLLRIRHRAYDRVVYAGTRALLGGHVRHAIVAGAPLAERLNHFFRGIGVPVLEGYGLTETTGGLTVNRPGEHKAGSVGRPLPGTTLRIADDGELLARGGQVFAGYWGDDEPARKATAAALADGWLHTGDVGEIDAEGFVRVTGRKKEILVTAGGKSVAPVVLEDLIRLHPLVSRCLVVGDGRPYVAALITLDAAAAAAWARRNARPVDVQELCNDPALRAELQAAVDDANASVSQAEAVRRFDVLPVDWTEEDGYLTPTLTLKRSLVLADFRAAVEALYA